MSEMTRRAAIGAAAAAAAIPLRARAQAPTLRIGVLNDMSGVYRDATGPTSAVCARQAVEDFGRQGFAIEVLSGDHQNKPDVGASIARQWFDRDGVDMILDVPTSSVALAVNSIAKEKNKVYVNCGGATTDLTGKDCTPNTVHWSYDTTMLATTVGGAVTKSGGNKWFFITADYVFGQQLQRDTTAVVTQLNGMVIGAAPYPFPSTTDFSSYLIQAQASAANVIGLANAGDDTVNCVKQAHEFGMTANGTKLAALLGSITVAHGIGIEVAQGLILTESFYWDPQRPHPRLHQARVRENAEEHAQRRACRVLRRHAALPQVGGRSRHRTEIGRRGGGRADEGDAGGRRLLRRTIIRADGRAMVTPYLFEVKKPSQSKSEWDLYNVISSLTPDESSPPLAACPLARA